MKKSHRQSIDRSLVQGIAWNGLARWTGQFVSWAILLYAARVLTPQDFGYVAMAMVPIGLARLVEDLGLDAAIVQKQSLNESQIAALGGVAVLVGLGLMLLYIGLAEFVSTFYNEPRVAAILRALSLLFVIDAFQIVPRALLQRELRFGQLAFVNGAQLVSSAIILGACAFFGLSYWSLVINHVLSGLIALLILVAFRRHRLAFPTDWADIAQSVGFGGKMLVARIAWYGYSNADQLVIGRFVGAAALGAYNFAMTFARIPVDEVSSLTGKVVPGVFSAVQHSRLKLGRYLLLLTEATSYITVPATVGLALVASDFVPIALGPQWDAAILPLQFLAIYTCVLSVTTLWSHVLIWTGNVTTNMLLSLLSLVVMPTAFYFGAKQDESGVALAWALAYPFVLVPAYFAIRRVLALPFRRFMGSLVPATISTAVMCAAVVLVRDVIAINWAIEPRFILAVTVGVVTYAGSLMLFFAPRIKRLYRVVRKSLVT